MIGSGITLRNINKFLKYANACIVGTYFKTRSYFTKENEVNIKKFAKMIDAKKVKALTSKKATWGYYFGKFDGLTKGNILEKIKKNNKTFYKYWKRYSEF